MRVAHCAQGLKAGVAFNSRIPRFRGRERRHSTAAAVASGGRSTRRDRMFLGQETISVTIVWIYVAEPSLSRVPPTCLKRVKHSVAITELARILPVAKAGQLTSSIPQCLGMGRLPSPTTLPRLGVLFMGAMVPVWFETGQPHLPSTPPLLGVPCTEIGAQP